MDWKTGFHRIGMVIAAPAAAVALACVIAVLAMFVAALFLGTDQFDSRSSEAMEAGAAALAIAIVWYGFWWAIGWVARGFVRSR